MPLVLYSIIWEAKVLMVNSIGGLPLLKPKGPLIILQQKTEREIGIVVSSKKDLFMQCITGKFFQNTNKYFRFVLLA